MWMIGRCGLAAALRGSIPIALLAAGAALAGCGKPPVPLDPRTGAVLDARYRPAVQDLEVAGTIRLRDALASAEVGTVFVSICEAETHRPARVRAYVYGGEEISEAKNGERLLRFRITSRDLMAGQETPMPTRPVVRVRYAPTGRIGAGSGEYTKEAPVRYGATDVEITLP